MEAEFFYGTAEVGSNRERLEYVKAIARLIEPLTEAA